MNWPENIESMSIDNAWQWRAEISVIMEDFEGADLARATDVCLRLTSKIDSCVAEGGHPMVLERASPTLENWANLK